MIRGGLASTSRPDKLSGDCRISSHEILMDAWLRCRIVNPIKVGPGVWIYKPGLRPGAPA